MPRSLQHDRQLFGVTLALCLIGAVMVFSASAMTAREWHGNAYFFLLRQLVWVAYGDRRHVLADEHGLPQAAAAARDLHRAFGDLVLLLAVFFLDRSHATHRWIRLGPLSLQPSEIAKLVVIFYLAWFLESRREPRGAGINNVTHTLLPAMGAVLLMVALVYKEPDMGTACMIFFIAAVMLFIAGISYKYIVGAAIAALPLIYLAIASTPYRLERLKAFLSPGADPQGHGFQLAQSLIAVGSGGFTGVGPDGKPPETVFPA